jgi:hypothetical protein
MPARPLTPRVRVKQLAARLIGSRAYASARSIYHLAQNAEERDAKFALADKLAAWRHGFAVDSAMLYDFSRNDPRDYVGEYLRLHRCSRINPSNDFYNHKLMWRSFMLSAGFAQAETVAVLGDGQVLIFPFDPSRRRYVSVADFERLLVEDGGGMIFKPERGERGQGVFLVEVQGGGLVRRRGAQSEPFRVSVGTRLTVVERRLLPHEFWREIFPHAANTIRALTLWTPGDPEPFLARAAQRFGTVDTMPTDNFSGGAICAAIDLETGRLGTSLMHPAKGHRAPGLLTHHPDTGRQIAGLTLPFWDRLRDTVLRAAKSVPGNRYIGWDVFVDASGAPVIVEANGNPGLQMVQVDRGLLTDPAIRRFYEKTGVV